MLLQIFLNYKSSDTLNKAKTKPFIKILFKRSFLAAGAVTTENCLPEGDFGEDPHICLNDDKQSYLHVNWNEL